MTSDRFYELEQKEVPTEVFLQQLANKYEKIQTGDVLVDEIEKERNNTLRRLSDAGV